jgi:DNA-binding CsgD family transcriptional regulator
MKNILTVLLDEMSDAVFFLAADRRLIYANPPARRLLRAPETLLDQNPTLAHLVSQWSESADSWSGFVRGSVLIDIDGSTFEARVFALPDFGDAHSRASSAIVVRPPTTTLGRNQLSDELPPRLHRIGELLSRGLSHKEVSDVTGLSQATVRTYNRQLHARLGVRNRAELVRKWLDV